MPIEINCRIPRASNVGESIFHGMIIECCEYIGFPPYVPNGA